jgi:hypothetical protein
VLPTGRYATLTHVGHPSELMAATKALLDWAAEQGLTLFRATNPVRIICAGQLLVRVFAARVVAVHNGPARSLWQPSLNPRPLTPSISIMGCGVAREYWLQFICDRGVNSGRLQFMPILTVC